MPVGQLPARQASRAAAYDGHELLDDVVVTVWRAPASYTGEDLVEISAHGSPYVLERMTALAIAAGARAARPGEFTFRAYRAGKLDLAQAEAVASLIRARTRGAHRAAARQLSGGLSERVASLRGGLLDLLARLEAQIDHAEDGVPLVPEAAARAELARLSSELQRLRSDVERGRLAHEGVRLAIVGPPNAGKSSLLNALVGRERAIVLDTPGTTRDTLEEPAELGGLPAVLVDTAGLREHALDPAERLGMERTRKAVEGADAVLFVMDRSKDLSEEDRRVMDDVLAQSRRAGTLGEILVLNKSDLPSPSPLPRSGEGARRAGEGFAATVEISAATGAGLAALGEAVRHVAGAGDEEGLFAANARHAEALARAAAALEEAARCAGDEEVAAACLRSGAAALEAVTGGDGQEEVLERIFSTFCVGK